MTLLTCAACGGNLPFDKVLVVDETGHYICDGCVTEGHVPAIPLSRLALRCPSCHVRELPRYREPARDKNGSAWCDACAEAAVTAAAMVARIKNETAAAVEQHRQFRAGL